MPIRWINAGQVSNYRSQSIYHGLGYAQKLETPDTIVVVAPENPYLCIGYFQDARKELDLAFCEKNQLPVIRRETGGGAVYIDSGQLFVQWIFQPGFLPRKVEHRFQLFNKALIETYKFFGIQAYHHPINDVHVNGKKIVGTGAATIGNAEVVTGNFLFDFNVDVMTRAFNLPNAEFRKTIRNSLENYMTWIKRELSHPPTPTEVIAIYKRKCELVLGNKLIEGDFTDDELMAIEKAENKLASKQWLHAIKANPSSNRVIKIHAGVWLGWMEYEKTEFTIQVFSQIRNSTVEMIKFYLHRANSYAMNLENLEAKLTNTPLEESAILNGISEFFAEGNVNEMVIGIEHWVKSVMMIKTEIQKVGGYV